MSFEEVKIFHLARQPLTVLPLEPNGKGNKQSFLLAVNFHKNIQRNSDEM
jgi:hypothetical protein